MRLLTRSDFDGLACGTLLKEVGVIDSWKFVHPKDLQDGIIDVTSNDVLANVPFVQGCGMWFDHHASEYLRLDQNIEYKGESRVAPSAARIIYEYYGGRVKLGKFDDLIKDVDKVDSGMLTADEVLHPTGYILLGYIMDPRTGLGRFKDFRISNYQLMERLMEDCRKMDIEEILAEPDVKERVDFYLEQEPIFRAMLEKHSRVDGNVIVTDMRGTEEIASGNRFYLYSIFPEQNVSIWVVDGKNKQNVVLAVGHSILNRTCKVNVGSLMLQYGGGGHAKVGTCQVPYNDADKVVADLIAVLKI